MEPLTFWAALPQFMRELKCLALREPQCLENVVLGLCLSWQMLAISQEVFCVMQVKTWATLPEFLREWGRPEMAGRLDAATAELHETWQLIKSRLRRHVAKTICALAADD